MQTIHAARPKVVVLTFVPSPYQVELFDRIAADGQINLDVVYDSRVDAERRWKAREPRHRHVFLRGADDRKAAAWFDEADLAVVQWYSSFASRGLLQARAREQRPMALWGERPGQNWGLAGRLGRRLLLRHVWLGRQPIWGIGNWAVDQWKREFGNHRHYHNVPYFSDLTRFRCERSQSTGSKRTVLFSGSLIPRKGVDVLAHAFAEVAATRPHARLALMGFGPLQKELERTLAKVASQVDFIGFVDWDSLPSVYAAADVLCVPSRHDGWGLVVPEGLAAGLPVIASDRMGAAIDLIRNGENGWLTRAGDVASLTTALAKALDAPAEELRDMSQDAARTACGPNSLAGGAQRFVDAVHASLAACRE